MTQNLRDRTYDATRRDDASIGRREICQVMDVMPHKQPYDGDIDFNLVELLLKHRPIPLSPNAPEEVLRKRCMCLQRDHGYLYGHPWTPKIGDLVLVDFIYEDVAIVHGILDAVIEQEPVCRPNSNAKCYDYVRKRCKFKMPVRADGLPDYVFWYPPEHPDCHKWWHDYGDEIWIFDCPLGHAHPWCNLCTNIDNISVGATWFKHFGIDTQTQFDKKWRYKFHHRSGSIYYFDLDGTFYLQNRVDEDPRAHVIMWPDATIELHSADLDGHGSRIKLMGERSPSPGEVLIENLEYGGTIRIHQTGKIELVKSEGSIVIDEQGNIKIKAPSITLDGSVSINGSTVSLSGDNVSIDAGNLEVSADSGSCGLIEG